jgi:hypothetical protein
MSLDKNINDVLYLQDVELANAMNDLKGDGTKLATFINSRKSDLYNAVSSEHSDSFQKVYGDLERSTNTTKNLLYYNVRNKDINNLQNALLNRSTNDVNNATYDNQIAKRQFEINEWTSGNKMDTLFFFQVLFIYLTLTAPLLYMKNAGFIPSSVFYGTTGLLTIAVIMTVIVRAQYTEKTRDNRFWNRRRFAQMGGPPVLPSCPAITGAVTDVFKKVDNLDTTISGQVTSYGNKFSNALNAFNEAS